MNTIRARFEEIWPVPAGVAWSDSYGEYMPFDRHSMTHSELACEWDARLDTFTRCQETTDVYVGLIDELVQEIESCHADLRKENWYVPRQSALLDRAKQIIGREK
ncbi:hypothetical protein D3C85_1087190 [compost metagenome]